MSGLTVPPDLILPLQKSFESMSALPFFHHPTMAYCSFYTKKVDPEPGRCRRTDGKKWRCSKDAYHPDSKYCERHMHRSCKHSRKPVESHTATQPSLSSSTVTLQNVAAGGSSGAGSFQDLPLHSFGNPQGNSGTGTNPYHFNMEPITYGTSNKDYRCIQGYKAEVGEYSIFGASGSSRGLQMDAPLDSTWSLVPSGASSFSPPKSSGDLILQNDYPKISIFSSEFALGEPVKQEGQSLRPFFDEWPGTRDPWSGLEEERSNQTSFSRSRLSIPMASSNFSTNSWSLHDN